MEDYIVSARKYRPSTFNTVIGQNSITSTLKSAIKNKQLAQAFLFTGPRGVGKTTCARILAKTINCLNIGENIEPCNECDSCKAFNTSASFNVHELDAASNNSVDDIRSLVEQVRVPPQSVQYKVYVIDEVHMLSPQAFNAFLKTLEEPPAYAKFILATTEKHKIIPTILSRCQIYDFNRITVDDIAAHLIDIAAKEKITADGEALHIIAQKADGSLRDALSIFDQISTYTGGDITYDAVLENLNIVDVLTFFDITEKILNNDMPGLLMALNDIIEKGHDGHHFILGMGDHFRNLLLAHNEATVKLLETTQANKERYLKQSHRCKPVLLLQSLDILNKADVNYKIVGNKRLLTELSVLQVSSLFSDEDTENKTQPAPQNITKPKESAAAKEVKTQESVKSVPKPAKKTETPKPKEGTTKEAKEAANLQQGAISISAAAYKQTENEDAPVAKEDTNAADVNSGVEDFSETQLTEAWTIMAQSDALKLPSFKALVQNITPKKTKAFTVNIAVGCELHKKEFVKNMGEVKGFLTKHLNVNDISFDIDIVKSEEIKIDKPFTAKEKYEKMSAKNSHLKEMKNDLKLDFDY